MNDWTNWTSSFWWTWMTELYHLNEREVPSLYEIGLYGPRPRYWLERSEEGKRKERSFCLKCDKPSWSHTMLLDLEARPHLYANSLAARMNVRPHPYDGELIFLWSTDSRRIAFACLPNIRRISEWRQMLFAYTSTLCVSCALSRSCTDVDATLGLHFNARFVQAGSVQGNHI